MEKKTPQTSAQKMAKRRERLSPILEQFGFLRKNKAGALSASQSAFETFLLDAFYSGKVITLAIDDTTLRAYLDPSRPRKTESEPA